MATFGDMKYSGIWDPNADYSFQLNSYAPVVLYNNATYIAISIPDTAVAPSNAPTKWAKIAITQGGSGNTITITTPDGKSNTVSTFNFLNGANVNITSDGNGNITISAPTSALPNPAGKANYLLSNDGTNPQWTNNLTSQINAQQAKTLSPVSSTTKTIYEVDSEIYAYAQTCKPIYSNTATWSYLDTTNRIEIPANTKIIILEIMGLSFAGVNPSGAIQFQNANGTIITTGYILGYASESTTGGGYGSYADRLININQTNGISNAYGRYTIMLSDTDTNTYTVQGSHFRSGDNTFISQNCYKTVSETPKWLYFNAGTSTFDGGKIIAWFQG